ncbi:MAG: DNA polymerase III subunit gamma/tau [Bacteroidales bacterium]|nr:DNA polymerase III subunit gamma/tau [Bacteroidales bacterium]
MSEYIVSARKYRPDSFETLIGQDNIARTLKNSILRGQLAHAYLFCGPRGVGKTSTARIFAKTINCMHPSANMEPCGQCESCVSFAEGRSYCIYELDAASNNSVEDIKTLMEKVQIPPQVGNYSVYIIDEVHMLSQAAFNAFLKTLEEPPSYAIFILCTTEKHKVLPTILSRCQTYDFNRIGISDMVRNLRGIADKEGVKVDDESLHVIAQKADGAMRDALTIFDQTVAFCGNDIQYADVIRNLGVLDYEYSFSLVDNFLSKDYASALLRFNDILSKGFNALHFVSALGEHFRNLLVARTGGLDSLLDLPDSLKVKYREQASRCSLKFIYDALGIITDCEAGYKASTNQRLHIEYALMKLAFLGGVPESPTPKVAAKSLNVSAITESIPPETKGDTTGQSADNQQVERHQLEVAAKADDDVIELIEVDTVPEMPEPAVAPAEAPAATSTVVPNAVKEPAAEPAKKRSSRAKAVMSGLLAGDDAAAGDAPDGDPKVPAAETAAPVEPPILSDDTIREKWPELVKECAAGKARLHNALSSTTLTMEESEGFKNVSFEVTNEAQKKWIEDGLLRTMENKFAHILGNGKVRLYVTVKPSEEVEKKVYMPAEKAQELMNSNPEVLHLVKDLGLDAN